jgi:hypothetical protein
MTACPDWMYTSSSPAALRYSSLLRWAATQQMVSVELPIST